jgi:fibronectin-binding autotransporter adhesin
VVAGAIALGQAGQLSAGTATWNFDGDGLWQDNTRWDTGSFAVGETAVANFGSVITADRVITLNADVVQIGTIALNDDNNYTITGFTLNMDTGGNWGYVTSAGGGAHTIASAIDLKWVNLDVTNTSAGDLTFSGVIRNSSGAYGSLTKRGTGNVVLSGANTFNGVLTVADGPLSIATINNAGAAGVLGNSTKAVVLGESGKTGTLRYTGSTASSDKAFTLATGGSGAIEVTGSGTTLTLAGTIDGSGSFKKSGPGTLTLTGANTFSGSLTVADGALSVAAINPAGANGPLGASASPITLGASGTTGVLQYTGGTATSARVLGVGSGGMGAVDVANAATVLTLTSPIGGAGELHKRGSGTLILSGANTYTGRTNITTGVLKLGAAGVLPDTTSLDGSGTLDLNGFDEAVSRVGGGVNVTNSAATPAVFTVGATNGTGWDHWGTIGGNLSMVKVGTGWQAQRGNQAFTGTLTVKGGEFFLRESGRLTASSGATVELGAKLTLDDNTNGANPNRLGSTPVTLVGGTLAFSARNEAGATSQTVATVNAPSGMATLTSTANGQGADLTVTNLNRTGAATVNFTGSGTLGTAGNNGRIFLTNVNGSPTANANGILGGWATVGSDFAAYDGTTGVKANTATTTLPLAGPSDNVLSVGNQTLTADKTINSLITHNDVLVNSGATLTIQSGGLIMRSGNHWVQSTTAGSYGFITTGQASGEFFATVNGTFTDMRLNNIIVKDNGSTPLVLVKSGDGLLSLSSVNTYTGATYVNSGTLRTYSNAALGSSAAGTFVRNGATLDVWNANLGNEPITLVGAGVGGNGALISGAAATATLAGSVTLAGDTTLGGVGNIAINGPFQGGAYNLTKVGTGTVTLNGTSSYASGTVRGGTIAQAGGASTISGNLLLADVSGQTGSYVLSGGSLNIAGVITRGAGTANLSLDGGSLAVGGGSISVTNLRIAEAAAANATYSLPTGLAINAAGDIAVGYGGTAVVNLQGSDVSVGNLAQVGVGSGSNGKAVHTAGNVTIAKNLMVAQGTSSTGRYELSGTGVLNVGVDEVIGGGGAGTFVQDGGTHAIHGNLYLGDSATATSNGLYELKSGSLTVTDVTAGQRRTGTFTQTGGTATLGGNLYLARYDAAAQGTVNLQGGLLDLAGHNVQFSTLGGTGTFNFTGGTLKNVGTFGATLTQNGGTLTPGNPVGATNVSGDYNLVDGILQIDINGLDQGDQAAPLGVGYDFLRVSGLANLDGALQALFLDGFAPSLGSSFDVLTASQITLGNHFSLSGGFQAQVISGGNGQILQLTFVPEPSTTVLLFAGAVALAACLLRRRRRGENYGTLIFTNQR